MLVGKKAPDFKAEAYIDGQIKSISLADFGQKYKIIFFYPLDFTFVCPTEIHGFQDELNEFNKRNAAVIGISVDSVFSHQAWANTPKAKGGIEGVTFPLVSDLTKSISREYDVLDEAEGIALRGLFILDKDNIIQATQITGKGVGRSIPEVLRLLDALIFTETHGEVCPVNWQKGEKAMVPNKAGVEEFFSKK